MLPVHQPVFIYILMNNAIPYSVSDSTCFYSIAYYVIFYMCLLVTLWRMNKYQSINQSINKMLNKYV